MTRGAGLLTEAEAKSRWRFSALRAAQRSSGIGNRSSVPSDEHGRMLQATCELRDMILPSITFQQCRYQRQPVLGPGSLELSWI